MRESTNSQVAHGNDVGRGSGTALSRCENVDECGVVVGENDANAEGSKNEEGSEAEIDGLEGVLDVNTGALGLTGDHGNVFGPNNAERSSPESTEETFEATKVTSGIEAAKWARVTPVTEAVGVFLGVATNHLEVVSTVRVCVEHVSDMHGVLP